MEKLLEWVWQITCCLIFITVLANLLPKKCYETYIRLFAGMTLILIVIKPVTESLNLDDKIAALFENVRFQEEAGEFHRKLSEMEQDRLDKMVKEYRSQVEQETGRMADSLGIEAVKVTAEIEDDPRAAEFGAIRFIEMEVRKKSEREEKQPLVTPVKPVEISQNTEDGQPASAVPVKADLEKTGALKSRIGDYYGVEEKNVEIRWKD